MPSDEEKGQKLVRDTLKKPARGFEGAEKAGKRNKPVEFERHTDELFGMDDLITKKVKKWKEKGLTCKGNDNILFLEG